LPPSLASVVFDFDGVIVNSEPLHLLAFQRVFAELGVELAAEDYYARYLGFDDLGVAATIAADRGLALDGAATEALLARKAAILPGLLGAPGVLFPGAVSCVRRLAGVVPLALASGARRDEIELVLRAAALDGCFPVVVAAGETARGKPAPDPYARALELLQLDGRLAPGTPASRSVAIEDSHWGLASARAAGLRTVALTTSYTAAHLREADRVVDSLDAVTPEALGALVAGVGGP